MSDPFATTPFYSTTVSNFELVWFEDQCAWYIRCTVRQSGAQTYSTEGWDDKASAIRAFDNTKITYVDHAPGQS